MGRRWMPEDRKRVHNLYPTLPTSELALLLERSEHSIEHQASLMGILKSAEVVAKIKSRAHQKDYHCEPYLTFRKMYLDDQFSIGAIAEKMECSISKVQKYLEREGLTLTLKSYYQSSRNTTALFLIPSIPKKRRTGLAFSTLMDILIKMVVR